MGPVISKKVVLCLIDCDSKSANEIAGEIGESLALSRGSTDCTCLGKYL